LYQVETTGYFDLVGSDLSFAGDAPDLYLAASTWLVSRMPSAKKHPVVYLSGSSQGSKPATPLTSAKDLIQTMDPPTGPSRGTVLSEKIGNDYFSAEVAVERESMLLLKATYHPNWRATVDGVETDTVMLMPSFVGIELSPGNHSVRIEYRPRRLRVILLVLGLLTLPLIAVGERQGTVICSWFATNVVARISSAKRKSSTRQKQGPWNYPRA